MSARNAAFRHRGGYIPLPSSTVTHFEMDWATPRLASFETQRSMEYGLGRKQGDSNELLAVQQLEQQLQNRRQSPNSTIQKKWPSCSNLTEVRVDDNRTPAVTTVGFSQQHTGHRQHYYGAYANHVPCTSSAQSYSTTQVITTTVPSCVKPVKMDSPPLSRHIPGNIPVDFASPPLHPKSSNPMHSAGPEETESRWDSMLIAKDDLIRQKDEIIDRQKKSLLQMQQQQVDMDSKLQLALITRSQDVNESVFVKLQECQYENKQLHAHLTQVSTEKNQEIVKLTQKLGEAEYQLQQMKSSVKDAVSTKEHNLRALEQKLVDKVKSHKELSDELEESRKEGIASRRQVESLKRYLADVPTAEEYAFTRDKLLKIRDENKRLMEFLASKEKKEDQMKKVLAKKSEDVKKLSTENNSLRQKAKSLNTSLDKYRKEGPVSEIEFEDLKMEQERVQAELERTKKSLAMKHTKMKALHHQAQKTQHGLEERLSHEEDAGTALRKEVMNSESTIQDLRTSIRDMAAQNQELLEENLNFKTICDQLQEAISKENVEAKEQLWKEVVQCITELKAVVQVCVARKDGKEPNMSHLLGITRSSLGGEQGLFDRKLDDLEAINENSKQVQLLRTDIDAIRTLLSDQYAEDVGNNCSTQ